MAVISLAWTVRLGMCLNRASFQSLRLFTPTSFDALTLGAVVAWCQSRGEAGERVLRVVLTVAGIAGFGAFLVAYLGNSGTREYRFWSMLLVHPSLALMGVALVGTASTGIPGVIGAILEAPPVRYVGRISYAIYLFHDFVPWMLEKGFPGITSDLAMNENFEFTAYTTISILMATISWYCLEAPVNGLKRYFPIVERLESRSSGDSTSTGEVGA
jgi:peptidoglycan/LPS O-acetylase OafA/YrhL